MGQGGLQHHIGAMNIGSNELPRPLNAAVHMRFRRKMHHRIRLEALENRSYLRLIRNVSSNKVVAQVVLYRSQRLWACRVGELVKINDPPVCLLHQIPHHG